MEEVNILDIREQEEAPSEQPQMEIDWAESQWFQDWLRLARRDYHGRIKRTERKGR